MRIKALQFIHTAKIPPSNLLAVDLVRDHKKYEVDSLEEMDRGVLMNGRYMFPWSVIMRVDYFKGIEYREDAEPLEFPGEGEGCDCGGRIDLGHFGFVCARCCQKYKAPQGFEGFEGIDRTVDDKHYAEMRREANARANRRADGPPSGSTPLRANAEATGRTNIQDRTPEPDFPEIDDQAVMEARMAEASCPPLAALPAQSTGGTTTTLDEMARKPAKKKRGKRKPTT